MKVNNLKDNIIINVFDYLDIKNDDCKIIAIKDLKLFAKHYHVVLSKKTNIELKKAFREFIINKNGYNTTINNLYHCLI